MITRRWAFKVYGTPKPKGSMKCIGGRGKVKHQLIEQVDDGGWRKAVAQMAHHVVREAADPHQPVALELWFTLPRPASHYGTGRNQHTVKASAPPYPTAHGTGDADKLERAVLDALQDVQVLNNDAQVIRLASFKHYPYNPNVETVWTDVLDRPGVVVRIRPLDGM